VTYAELAASVYKATEEVIGPLSLGDLVFGLQVRLFGWGFSMVVCA
jgi:hypothetical protein